MIREIFEWIKKKHDEYINSERDDEEQPNVALTTQQCFKLANYLHWTSKHQNYLSGLTTGVIRDFNFESVRILKKETIT